MKENVVIYKSFESIFIMQTCYAKYHSQLSKTQANKYSSRIIIVHCTLHIAN